VLEGTGKEMLVAKEMMWSHAQVNLTMMLKMLQVLKGSYLPNIAVTPYGMSIQLCCVANSTSVL
jgi:hypothetical protein